MFQETADRETPLQTPIEDDSSRMRQLFERNGSVRRVDFDPVTRVAGALAFHTVVDLDSREVLETAARAASAAVCHANCAALATEMAFGISPAADGSHGHARAHRPRVPARAGSAHPRAAGGMNR